MIKREKYAKNTYKLINWFDRYICMGICHGLPARVSRYREIPQINSRVFEPEIQRFITKLLATNPGDRFQKASGALAELDYIEDKYDEFLLDHVISFYDFLITGKTEKVHVTIEELARGICLCKKKGFYIHGAFLFEKSGLNLITLPSHLYSDLEEDYRVCRNRAGQEVIPE